MSEPQPSHFIRQIIEKDRAAGKNEGRVATRFPPEPNGYLHIGHAKSICLNFGLAQDYDGTCNLRFDDTNPEKESVDYARAIEEDVAWLGYEWTELCHASDYFEQLYAFAIELIEKGLAYVDELSADQIREYRGTLTEPGRESPYRSRSVEENRSAFEAMRAGDFADGKAVLRAKIDMASPNINLRDPVLYRVKHTSHHRAGDAWCIYPMYDFTHGISDALEGVTHSLCTLEFEDHRPLYDWILDNVNIGCHPHQIEFSRLEMLYTITSKRKLLKLVEEGIVDGWDDPRMPTLSAMRRRGYPPEAIREFCRRLGVSKAVNRVELSVLEGVVRDVLGPQTRRVFAVLDPIRIVITNLPEDHHEEMECPYHPQRPELGTRKVPFHRELFIERDDFMEEAPKKYFRLKPGGAVRLRYAYIIDFQEMIKDEAGNIVEIRCTYDPATRSGQDESGRKVKGTIHWVSARSGVPAAVRLYDRMFVKARPDADPDVPFTDHLNSESLVEAQARVEPALLELEAGESVQFERNGYFITDSQDHRADQPVFNRTVTLRDSWSKIEAEQAQAEGRV